MLHVRQIAFDYQYDPVFEQVDFELKPSELLLLQGNNGSGKTTLLKIVAGLLMPRSGDIIWQGESIYSKLRTYQPSICYVGHKLGINPALTVRENCQFDRHWTKKIGDEGCLLQHFDLENIKDKRCSVLSQGQQKRVTLSRLAMSKEKLWLLDEPLTAIDHDTQRHVMQLIEHHLACQGMVIMTSHQPLPQWLGTYKEYRL